MARSREVLSVWLVVAILGVPGPATRELTAQAAAPIRDQVAPAAPPQRANRSARLTVQVPHPDTVLSLDGHVLDGTGPTREVESSPIEAPGRLDFTLTATWKPNGYTEMTRTKTVALRAGDTVTVDLTRDDPTDRVKVIYVPTPQDIAAEMVKLAGVTPDDVVFEPGCGDARITIAAIKAGAQRAICVDLDPDRATESRVNVQEAGLADRIDVRQGDALDVKDLSEVSVVLLYMGDHFNMLIRPVLWRVLKPGARIVSHRFMMGDWQPDRTISIQSDDGGGIYDLHLWTITDEVKRRAAPH